ncbi:hypothetical protein CEP53_013908 [Fusarium sp. AF-6]|nr:hypothetical protein CEP53_013908 [Fusarium sp. AF-6]
MTPSSISTFTGTTHSPPSLHLDHGPWVPFALFPRSGTGTWCWVWNGWCLKYRPLSHHFKSGRSRASATRRRALPVAFVNLYTISSLRTFELVSSVRLFEYLID